jgi:hypothetical protein
LKTLNPQNSGARTFSLMGRLSICLLKCIERQIVVSWLIGEKSRKVV